MTDQANILAQFSTALAARVAKAKNTIAAIRLSDERHLTGTLWRSDVIVTSEQSLPRAEEFEVVTAGGDVATGRLGGRDPATNIAILKLETPLSSTKLLQAEAQVGALAIAIGADSIGDPSARLGMVNLAGPEWISSRGGRIDRRIALDVHLARREEGGPVFDAEGGFLGMSTFGPRSQVLVIPAATIERIGSSLVKDGRIARGWLGVALQAVAVPDELRDAAGQSSGLMVMSTNEDGPARKAGVLPGDIILAVDGASTRRYRHVSAKFGTESIGRKTDLRLIRSGAVISVQATVAERPSA
jgi:S1-C subfamily serine protease